MKNKVVELFEKYGFEVEPVGDKGLSFIATDERFCVPLTVINADNYPEIDAVSFMLTDKETLLSNYKDNINKIGRLCYEDYIECELKNVTPLSGICGVGISMFSVEVFLKSAARRRK